MNGPSAPFGESIDDEPLLSDHRGNIQGADDPCIVIAADFPPLQYRTYKWRFFLVAVVVILNISNGMNWITFSPVANLVGEYYNIDSNWVNYLALVFPLATVPFGFVGIAVLDSIGLRAGILIGALLNCIGAVLRMISTLSVVPGFYKYPALMGGQCLCAVAQPFILFVPTKLAATWFPPSQRAKANTAASMANPVGILVANFLSPYIMNGTSDKLPFLLELYIAPAALGCLLALVGVCRSKPLTPPSPSAAEEHQTVKEGIKMLFRNKSYWVLAVCQGTGVALFTALTTLLQQLLCPQGYSDTFAGICGALIIGCGILGAGVAGVIVDKTKKFELVAKVALCLATVCMAAFTVLCSYPNMAIPIAVSLSLFGLFGFAMYPVALEMAVETTFPVSEATSSGIILIVGQVLSLAVIVAMQAIATPLSHAPFQSCTPETPMNYTFANIVLCGLGGLGSVLFLFGFRCQYRRMESERAAAAEQVRQAEATNRDWPYIY